MFAEKFGGKKAFLRHSYFKVIYGLGGFNKYMNPDWQNVRRLVFVCKGNINRSPYGEYKARSIGLASFSCGINADETKGASIDAIRNARTRSIDLTSHHCQSIHNITLEDGDMVLAMEPAHLEAIIKALNIDAGQVTLLGAWSDKPTPYIQDPICREDDYFQTCFNTIDRSLERIKINIDNT